MPEATDHIALARLIPTEPGAEDPSVNLSSGGDVGSEIARIWDAYGMQVPLGGRITAASGGGSAITRNVIVTRDPIHFGDWRPSRVTAFAGWLTSFCRSAGRQVPDPVGWVGILEALCEYPRTAPTALTWDPVNSTVKGKEVATDFRGSLASLLAEFPVEVGVENPAEQLLTQYLSSEPTLMGRLILPLIDDPSFEAKPDLMLCLGRVGDVLSGDVRQRLLRTALRNPDARVRYSAVKAAEMWGDYASRSILNEHVEAEGWLQGYIGRAIADMTA